LFDILDWDTFLKLKLLEDDIRPHYEKIMGFSGERISTKGYVDLKMRFGIGRLTHVIDVRYLVIEAKTSYNVLFAGFNSVKVQEGGVN